MREASQQRSDWLDLSRCVHNFLSYPSFDLIVDLSEEYDIEVLCTIFDNFVMGNPKVEATPDNPCKLAIMNNILKKDLVKLEVKEEPTSVEVV